MFLTVYKQPARFTLTLIQFENDDSLVSVAAILLLIQIFNMPTLGIHTALTILLIRNTRQRTILTNMCLCL